MQAAFIRKYGNNEVVEVGNLPTPQPGPSDLLIRVQAASVNPVDFKIRDGMLKTLLPYRFPLVLGNDLAGTVAGVGSAVTRFKKGDEIFARLDKQRIGSFAEYALVDESNAATKPANLRFDEASSIPLVGLTSWQALIDLARLSAGQKVLIHAGSGGVGTFAIQLAKYLGATVATTVGERNIELVRQLGADIVIDYRKQRFDAVLRDYDVVFDTLGEDTQLNPTSGFAGVTPQRNYKFTLGFSAVPDLTDARCNSTQSYNSTMGNGNDPRGFAWCSGEYRCALYNHYYSPNAATFDCITSVTVDPTLPPQKLYSAYGWRTARSAHPGGVNTLHADGGVQFTANEIDLLVWRSLSTRNQQDNVAGTIP